MFIASPVAENIAPSEVHNLIATTEEDYDLYRFNQSDANGNEWQNWKAEGTDNYHFNLEPGKGYLYATKETRTLMFAGEYTLASGSVAVPLDYDENAQFAGWNLVGNPFTVGATSSQPYYRMNAEGTALNTSTESTAVAAMEGVFVQAAEDGDTVNFTAQTRGGEKSAVAALNITVIKGGVSTSSTTATTLDNAIIRFDGGQTLEKFSMRQGSTRIYLPQGGKDYAIANAEAQTGEIPVNFKATENGTYTLGFSSQEVSFSYLHLIDNLTGDDIDLLATPDYTFQAKTTDYASRFKLVFVCEDAMGDDGTFAFFNGSEWMISNEGRATLQVVDAMGRVLRSETINGNATINTNGLSAGVYMLRLINGENVSVQKIVVR